MARPARGRPRQPPRRDPVAARPRSRERATLAHALVVFWYTRGPRTRRTRLARGGARTRVAGAERHACGSTRLGGLSLERARRRRSRTLEQAVACAGRPTPPPRSRSRSATSRSRSQIGRREDRRPGRCSDHRGAGRRSVRPRHRLEQPRRVEPEQGTQSGRASCSRRATAFVPRWATSPGWRCHSGTSPTTAYEAGDVSRAHDFATQALALARKVGDRRDVRGAVDNSAGSRSRRAASARRANCSRRRSRSSSRSPACQLHAARCTGSPLSPPRTGTGTSRHDSAAAAEPDVHGEPFRGHRRDGCVERTSLPPGRRPIQAEWDEAWAAGAA